jgi:hypothetical protein
MQRAVFAEVQTSPMIERLRRIGELVSAPLLDAAASPLQRAKIAGLLAAKVAELTAMKDEIGGAIVMRRARLAKEVNDLCVQLGGHGVSSEYEKTLSDIASGRRDGEGLAELYGMIQEAVQALQSAGGLTEGIDAAAQKAITHWAELEEKA